MPNTGARKIPLVLKNTANERHPKAFAYWELMLDELFKSSRTAVNVRKA